MSSLSKHAARLLPSLLILIVMCGAGELALRLALPVKLGHPLHQEYDLLWQHDSDSGWSIAPNSSAVFTNGFFRGSIHVDELGIRKNSQEGTFRPEYRSIFFIGDSVAASFEVDDHETPPARLEQQLRAQGKKYNVLNLGVRGYGTDQAVRRAIALSKHIAPSEVIYMYVINDPVNNVFLKRAHRVYGKGVYIRKSSEEQFEPLNYPVPLDDKKVAGFTMLDEQCRPVVHQALLQASKEGEQNSNWSKRIKKLLNTHLYTYRALRQLRDRFSERLDPSLRQKTLEFRIIDPYSLVRDKGVKWTRDFQTAHLECGYTNERCKSYFHDQIKFLLSKLREIPSVRRVHVIRFADILSFLRRKEKLPFCSVDMFQKFYEDNVIDSYVNLTDIAMSEDIDVADFLCPQDQHWCEQGNRWLARKILQQISFE